MQPARDARPGSLPTPLRCLARQVDGEQLFFVIVSVSFQHRSRHDSVSYLVAVVPLLVVFFLLLFPDQIRLRHNEG